MVFDTCRRRLNPPRKAWLSAVPDSTPITINALVFRIRSGTAAHVASTPPPPRAPPPPLMLSDPFATSLQGSTRGWGVALATHGFPRGSGIYRWRVRLDSVNRRGHIFLGVATRQTALGSYLGADRHGWGYLVSQDLYHGGSRLRSGYGSRMSAGMTVELTLNTDIGLLSVGNADTGEDFGPAMNNLYEDIDSAAGGVTNPYASGGNRDTRIDARGGGGAARLSAAAAASLSAAGRGGGTDAQGTLWPAFAMHQPGDSVTFLTRRGDDGFAMPRALSGSATAAPGGADYRSLQSFMGGAGGGMIGGMGGGPAASPFVGQTLPLGYPDPRLVEHACAALEMATGVLRDAGRDVSLNAEVGEDIGVVAR